MPIVSLSIGRFKGISRDVTIDIRPITLLFGANSAGKSTILQAMLYLRECVGRRNFNPDKVSVGGAFVDLGGFKNLVHQRDWASAQIALGVEVNLSSIDLVDYYELGSGDEPHYIDELSGRARSAKVDISLAWSDPLNCVILANYQVCINGQPAARLVTKPTHPRRPLLEYNAKHEIFSDADDTAVINLGAAHVDSIEWVRVKEQSLSGASPGSSSIESTLCSWLRHLTSQFDLGEISQSLRYVLIAPAEYVLEQLERMIYLGPIREAPPRGYSPPFTRDEARWATGLAAWDWLHSEGSDTEIGLVNDWLKQSHRLNAGFRLHRARYKELDVDGMALQALMTHSSDFLDNVERIREEVNDLQIKTRLMLRRESDFLEVQPQDVGIGISQLVPVVVASLLEKDGLRIIEQPELHIHPAVQVGIGDLLIAASGADGIERTFLVETHSEHLILRILRRLRETAADTVLPELAITAEDVAVYIVEAADGKTEIRRLRLTDDGRFEDRWPHGFFEEREREFFGDLPEDIDEQLDRFFKP